MQANKLPVVGVFALLLAPPNAAPASGALAPELTPMEESPQPLSENLDTRILWGTVDNSTVKEGAFSVAPDGAASDPQILAARHAYGLSTSAEDMAAAVDTQSSLIGIPLSAAEEAQVRRQLGAQDRLRESYSTLEGIDGFAGASINHRQGGVVTLRFTSDAGAEQAQRVLQVETGIDVRKVEYSYAHLTQVHDDLLRKLEMSDWVIEGVTAHEVETSIERNRVELRVEQSVGLSNLLAVLPPSVDVRVVGRQEYRTAMSNVDSPNAGGQSIKPTWVGQCSTAFPVASSVGQRGVLTAGHCGGLNSYWTTNSTSALPVGFMVQNILPPANSSVDAGVLGWNENVVPKVYYPNNGVNSNSITVGSGWNNGIPAGTVTHATMARSNVRWVTPGLDQFDVSVNFNGTTYTHVQTSYGICGLAGDSGSPVYTVGADGKAAAGGIMAGINTANSADQLPGCQTGEKVVWTRTSTALWAMNYHLITG